MTPLTRGNNTNRPSFTGEVYGINGNGEFQGGGGNNQSAIGNYSSNGTSNAVDPQIGLFLGVSGGADGSKGGMDASVAVGGEMVVGGGSAVSVGCSQGVGGSGVAVRPR